MADLPEGLLLLQFGDSFFPSGGASFSWGLETLRADGYAHGAADVDAFVGGQIRLRWASFDRPAVIAAYRARGDLDLVASVDREVESGTLAREAREGGRRMGLSILNVHANLGTPGAASYLERVRAAGAPGQMAAVHGLVGYAAGLSETATCALSAYGVAMGIASAALRMGLLGHVDSQRILARARLVAVEAAGTPVPDRMHAYTPMAEIAMMRHETGSGRLFAS